MTEATPADALRIDCHVHTADSFDSSATVEGVLRRAAAVGLDGVVVTDHDRIERSLRAAARAPAYGLVGIPGVEVSTADGHLLAIGVDSLPEPGRPLESTVDAVRAQGGLAVVPHPFQWSRHGASASDITDCDGIEVFNAHSLSGVRNRQASRFAERFDYPTFAGSDAHRPALVGRGITHVGVREADPTADSVLEAMRKGRTQASGRRTTTRRYVGKLAYNARLKGPRVSSL